MTYSIFDDGNLVASFEIEDEAQAALDRLAADEAQSSETLMLVAFDDDGNAVADCAPGESLFTAA
jgi:hypothetical protein